jgi:hypothetical protein
LESDTRDILLYARLVDLHRRKTEAELMGFNTRAYDALVALYELELAEIAEARQTPAQDSSDVA